MTAAGDQILPVFHELRVQTANPSGEGQVIALRFGESGTEYLVVSTTDATGRPRWVADADITIAQIGPASD